MQDRLRQIIEEQMPYIGQGALVGGARTHAQRAKTAECNPWINFLKYISDHCQIPYTVAMRDPRIREIYQENYSGPICGTGELIGGAPIKKTCYSGVYNSLKNRFGLKSAKAYKARTGTRGPCKKAKRVARKRTVKRKPGTFSFAEEQSRFYPRMSKAALANIIKDCINS